MRSKLEELSEKDKNEGIKLARDLLERRRKYLKGVKKIENELIALSKEYKLIIGFDRDEV